MTEDLFAPFTQRAVEIRGRPARSPLFFRDASMMGGLFTTPTSSARAALAGHAFAPLEICSGTAIVAVQCFEYRDTDVGPYNEVSVSVAVARPGERRARTLLRALLHREFSGVVLDLPVNTEISVHGGIDFFGFPKWLAEIQFEQSAGERRCLVLDPITRAVAYAATGRVLKPRGMDTLSRFRTYPRMDGRVVEASMRWQELSAASSLHPSAFSVEVGPAARATPLELGRLLAYRFVPSARAVLAEPPMGTSNVV